MDGKILNVFTTIISASTELGIRKTNIIECLKGRKNSAGGYKWEYNF